LAADKAGFETTIKQGIKNKIRQVIKVREGIKVRQEFKVRRIINKAGNKKPGRCRVFKRVRYGTSLST